MSENKRRHHDSNQPQPPHPCRPARRINIQAQAREERRLGSFWP